MMIIYFLLFICKKSISPSPSHALSSTTVLLPKTSKDNEQVLFDLSVTGEGCFRVSNSRDDIISFSLKVTIFDAKLNTYCSRSIRLQAISQFSNREGTVVSFIDVISGLTLRTQIFVDILVRLEIITRRRVMLAGFDKEPIEVIGYDASGNVFSSLTGALFEWKLSCESCKNRYPISFTSFQSSNYDVDDVVLDVELKGSRTSVILVESHYLGEVTLSTRMLDPLYAHITAKVRLLVRENIVLEPETTQYIIPGGFKTFKAIRIMRGKKEIMKFHPKTYELSASEPNVTIIHNDYKTIFGGNIGQSTISLLEKNKFSNELDPFQVIVNVVDPTHLTLSCDTQKNWVLEINKSYVLDINFHYFDRILETQDLTFDTNITLSNDKITAVISETTLQKISIFAKSLGVVELTVMVSSFTTPFKTSSQLSSPLTATIQIEIVDLITISPSLIVAPFLEDYYSHICSFEATGGIGRYTWGSETTRIFLEPFLPDFKVPNAVGIFNVTCSDRSNPFIKSNATLMVLPVLKMSITSEYSDAPLGTFLSVDVQLIANSPLNHEYINITHVPYDILVLKFSENNIFIPCDEPFFSSTSFCVIANSPGCITLLVQLKNSTVYSSIRLCAFIPLKVISKIQYAIPGSFITVILAGGPLSVQTRRQKQEITTVIPENIFSVFSTDVTEEEVMNRTNIVKLICLRPGTVELSFISSNIPVQVLPKPYKSIVKYTITCLEPEGLVLRIIPFDAKQQCSTRPYMCSSLKCVINFTLFTNHRFLINDLSGFQASIFSLPLRSISKKGSHLTTPLNFSSSGSLFIRSLTSVGSVKVILFLRPTFHNYSISLKFLLQFVPRLKILENRVNILNYELNSRDVIVKGGSGNFDINLPNPIVFITQTQSILHIQPIRTGFSVLIVKDRCVSGSSLKFEIFVTFIKSVSVIHSSKIMTNQSLKVHVLMYNDINEIIPNEEQHYLNIRFRFIDKSPDEVLKSLNNPSNHAIYELYSVSPRIVDFIVEVTLVNNVTVTSKKYRFEVFDPVLIIPESLNMIPGMLVLIKTTGGPILDVFSRFSISNYCLRYFESNSTLYAIKPCEGHISLSILSNDLSVDTPYTQCKVPITVSPVIKVEIDTVGNKIFINSKVPTSVLIFNKYGVVTPYLSISDDYSISWSVDKPAHITTLFYGSSLTEDKIVLIFLKEGTATLHLSFSDDFQNSHTFYAEKLLFILRSLNIFPCYNRLLLPPGTLLDFKEKYFSVQAKFKFVDPIHHGFSIDSSNILTVPNYPMTELVNVEIKDSRDDVIHQEFLSFPIEVANIGAVFILPHSELTLARLPVGQTLVLQLLAIDQLGRVFDHIPQHLVNVSFTPAGVIELVDFQNMILRFKGIILGTVFVHLHSVYGKTWTYKVSVDNPFSFSSISLSLGTISHISLPSLDEWSLSDPGIVSWYSSVPGSIYLMGMSVGECLIKLNSRDVFYDIFKVTVNLPHNVSFDANCPTNVTDRFEYYYFDLVIDEKSVTNNVELEFTNFPFTCNLYGYKRGAFSIRPIFYKDSGVVSCELHLSPSCSYEPCHGALEIRIEAVFNKESTNEKFISASKILKFYPKLFIQPNDSIVIDRCDFDGISLSKFDNDEYLEIRSSLDCIKSSYIYEEDDTASILIKVNKCLGIIKNSRNETLTVIRKSTGQVLKIQLKLDFENLSCLHASIIGFHTIMKIIFTFCALAILLIFSTTFRTLIHSNEIFNILMNRVNLIKIQFSQAFSNLATDGVQQMSPKPCSLKSTENSFENQADLTRELYTTRREFLHSSFL